MKSKAVEGIILLLVTFSLSVLAETKTFKDFPPGYKKWLEEDVAYIITPLEKGVFLRLNSDRERDLFIEAFWRQRDHSPGTPLNKFKEEHYSRIQYANRMFGRTTSHVFKAGHRIRMSITSSAFPHIDRNTNTGGPFGEDAQFNSATQTIYHDEKHPSLVMLPIIPR